MKLTDVETLVGSAGKSRSTRILNMFVMVFMRVAELKLQHNVTPALMQELCDAASGRRRAGVDR